MVGTLIIKINNPRRQWVSLSYFSLNFEIALSRVVVSHKNADIQYYACIHSTSDTPNAIFL